MLEAAGSFGGFDPRRGPARAWRFEIAAHVFARHCAQVAGGRDAALRLAGCRPLEVDEFEELAASENCTAGPGAGVPNPPIKLVVNTDNADDMGSTGAVVCIVGPHTYSGPYPGNSGATGSGNSDATATG